MFRRVLKARLLWRVVLTAALAVWAAGCGVQTATPAPTVTPTDTPAVTPPAPCSFGLSPASASFEASGGTGSVTVTTEAHCSWAASSSAGWVNVTGGGGRGSGSAAYRVAANDSPSARTASIEVVGAEGQQAPAVYKISQAASTPLRLRGTYSFKMEVDPDGACGWPVTTFYWPVSIKISSYQGGTTTGSIVFPSRTIPPSNAWSITTGLGETRLVPGQDGPGAAGGAYGVTVDGGQWEAGGLTRAHDGRGEITGGTATGVTQILTRRGSGERWECRSDVTWSLLVRYVDRD